jgi:hypothetical protein
MDIFLSVPRRRSATRLIHTAVQYDVIVLSTSERWVCVVAGVV